MQREAPPRLPLGFGRGARGGHRGRRQSRQLLLFGQHQFIRIGRVEHVFGKLGGQLGQRHVDFLEPRLARRIELRAVPLEGVHGLGEEPLHRSRQRPRLPRRRVPLDRVPQSLIQGQARIERAHLGLHGIKSRAQRRSGRDAFQVPDHVHRVIQALRHHVQRVQRPLARNGLIQPPCGVGQQFIDGRLDVRGFNLIERNAERNFKQRVHTLPISA